ncbi:MFS transporter, partial [Burkholderia sp. Bp8990]
MAASMIGFALLSLASAAAGSIVEMSVLRLLTALFLGLAVPATIAGATGHASAGRRSAVAAAVATGISAGGAIGGGMAALL